MTTREYKRRCKVHAKKRAEERYGINLTSKLRKRLLQSISEKHRNAKYLYRSKDSKIYSINVDGTLYRVAYDPIVRTIRTLLPAGKFSEGQIKKLLRIII